MDNNEIKTPETHPDHQTVGHHFGGYSGKTQRTEIYFCDSYDPRCGFWLTNVNNPEDRKNVSERAIGGTFHQAHDEGKSWYISQWSSRIRKESLRPPEEIPASTETGS